MLTETPINGTPPKTKPAKSPAREFVEELTKTLLDIPTFVRQVCATLDDMTVMLTKGVPEGFKSPLKFSLQCVAYPIAVSWIIGQTVAVSVALYDYGAFSSGKKNGVSESISDLLHKIQMSAPLLLIVQAYAFALLLSKFHKGELFDRSLNMCLSYYQALGFVFLTSAIAIQAPFSYFHQYYDFQWDSRGAVGILLIAPDIFVTVFVVGYMSTVAGALGVSCKRMVLCLSLAATVTLVVGFAMMVAILKLDLAGIGEIFHELLMLARPGRGGPEV